jgi:hypothetical protein
MGEAKRRKRYQQQTGHDWPRTPQAIRRQRNMPISEFDPHTETSSMRLPPRGVGWNEALGGCWHGDVFDPGARPCLPPDQWDHATAEWVADLQREFAVAVVSDEDGVKILCTERPWQR